jgi:hypothetical protein
MCRLISKLRMKHFKVCGFLPGKFNYIFKISYFSALITTVPFQFWRAYMLINNRPILISHLFTVIIVILMYLKFLILWINRRSVILIFLL